MTYDHILPVSKNGETSYENLCLACHTCNEFKGDATAATDPLLGETTGSWQLLVILAGGRQRAEGRRQKKERYN